MKPLIVGLHNPLSNHPRDALLPFPPGSTGWRLLMMIREVEPETSRLLLIDGVDRRNLWRGNALPSGKGSAAAYRAEGRLIFEGCFGRSDVLLLGARVWDSVTDRLAPGWFESKEVIPGTRFWNIPHPSARNVIYNNRATRQKLGRLLLEVLT